MKNYLISASVAISALVLQGCGTAQSIKQEAVGYEPLNVILMIGDGMGIPQVSSAFYFGDRNSNFERFETIGLHKSYSTSHLITDSAAGATAFSTGEKTYKRAIGVSKDSIPQETILEKLKAEGYQTGLISLTSITHATPAAFYAHVKDRDMHEEIAAQLATADVDFLAGGGRKFFNERSDDQDLFQTLLNRNYNLDTLALSKSKPDMRNAFIIEDEGLPSKTEGRGDFLKNASLEALSYFDANNKPFFLMIEGSYIDWGGHAKDAEMMIQEVADFDQTIGAVLDYVEAHPNTLLVITADHETGGASIGKYYEVDEETGKKTEVPEKVAVYFITDQHSGELIPVFAAGKGADNFKGIYQNSAIYHKILNAIKGKN
ncbi:MAG TPA: alkaline phosphatase [Leeuwenhoekiella sp.]|uniref:alkaline phosphatase n=1 Tax=Leeuwenhoekiella palythoae TaxID=573501 RepID=UPI000C5DFC30|nr:alkaline phosphatase [Leeuwenhoekiella palythoae]MAS21158.1 alkaline phosphatase [Leeuwenhoekiella sp.]MBH13231.1 alkaline phosphatase [Leeuwenhoekiella sp.]UBZ08933.1 alkaline phosphatase [Leeuwenhoekiella palythoae]HBO29249.1 alkaline phosphatase [Leeuwenhoekiella sp.]HCQ76406.1 alkaline phosphatase [Leeuwenhoekiella sp.]|tara:strand:- start:2440 stop:3564 length:1125 start_codon:yes stop_codon:yes gene_type:complete